ncbi:hypothetical protein K458DRAFT_452207 [Lentithecium fluviatile CBS 122367]|uniref:Uncharacterized protein n=1 Tax=Lentithecium fluviatile CBS 122367 TaxID=1168545 RepID=A0A6G1IZB6_9PLEO|nr:hypothetical protein K458DRAFT_452207 [Lentithecium fluviatile CBS 122367]
MFLPSILLFFSECAELLWLAGYASALYTNRFSLKRASPRVFRRVGACIRSSLVAPRDSDLVPCRQERGECSITTTLKALSK